MIGQGHNEEILRSHLAKYNVQVELNSELVSFEQDANSVTVNILKRDGTQEKTETALVDWLVGADSAKSQSTPCLCYSEILTDSLQAPFVSSLGLSSRGKLVKPIVSFSPTSS